VLASSYSIRKLRKSSVHWQRWILGKPSSDTPSIQGLRLPHVVAFRQYLLQDCQENAYFILWQVPTTNTSPADETRIPDSQEPFAWNYGFHPCLRKSPPGTYCFKIHGISYFTVRAPGGADIGSVFFSNELLTVHASCTKVVGYLENRIDTMHKNAPMLPSIRNAQEMHMISQTPRNCQAD